MAVARHGAELRVEAVWRPDVGSTYLHDARSEGGRDGQRTDDLEVAEPERGEEEGAGVRCHVLLTPLDVRPDAPSTALREISERPRSSPVPGIDEVGHVARKHTSLP